MQTAGDGRPRVVLVVGGSSGIGRATAHLLAARGDTVVLAGRGAAPLEQAVQECRAAGAVADAAVCDVRDADAVQALVAGVLEAHGRLDAVVHSAGVVAYGRFEDLPVEVFDGVLDTNVRGAANVARAALPVLRRQRSGTLLLVGSVLGDLAVPTMTPYVVSKHAVRSLGRQLALENRDLPGVRVSVLSPGSVDTPIYRQAANWLGRAGRPPAPVYSPERVARRVVATLDAPRDRVSVGFANPLMRAGFTLLPPVYDALVGPLFRLAGTRPGHQAPTAGNVLAPVEAAEGVAAGYGQGAGDVVGTARRG